MTGIRGKEEEGIGGEGGGKNGGAMRSRDQCVFNQGRNEREGVWESGQAGGGRYKGRRGEGRAREARQSVSGRGEGAGRWDDGKYRAGSLYHHLPKSEARCFCD